MLGPEFLTSIHVNNICTRRRNKNCKSKPTLPKVRLKHSTPPSKTVSMPYSSRQLTDDTQLHVLTGFVFAALVGREVSALPEQRDTPRPHHQVPATPTQEEETTQHQCTIPGQCRCRPLLENLWTVITSVTQQQLILTARQTCRFHWFYQRYSSLHMKQKDKRYSVP